jgi:fructokinase
LRVISIGEILWDVIGQTEYLGGAPLNFAAHAHKLGHDVDLVSAVGEDDRGRLALDGLRRHGVSADFVQVLADKKTGTAEVDLDRDGKPAFRIVRPAAYDFVQLSAEQLRRIVARQPEWIYFGTLYHCSQQSLSSTLALLEQLPSAKRFYDVNLRDGNWNLNTVEQLAAQASVIKLSDSEAEFLDASLNTEGHQGSVEHFCRRWSDQYRCKIICVTLGERGCGIYTEGVYTEVAGYSVQVADTVGAGDGFAAAFLYGLDQGWNMPQCGAFANAAGALVASRAGAIPEWSAQEAQQMMASEFPKK